MESLGGGFLRIYPASTYRLIFVCLLSRYLLPLLHLLKDFAIAEGLDCRPFGPQCYWNGAVHHWSLVYGIDDEGQMLAYVDIALDLTDLQAMRLRVMACADISEGNAEQLAIQVGSLTGLAVAPSNARP